MKSASLGLVAVSGWVALSLAANGTRYLKLETATLVEFGFACGTWCTTMRTANSGCDFLVI